ncbi:DUF4148 domain-containing protein [Undibacterium sp. TJN25]|uniref:DUF4148 domain-containing protein n=1 Tax=Undibacterium sp. TJN25 TaxID=3413056 RepID=UPI003BF3115E
MNTKHIIAASLLILTGATAFAADYQTGGEAYASFPIPNSFSNAPLGQKTRAEVKAELAQARAEGQLVSGDAYPFQSEKTAPTTLSRAEVKAEAIKSARAGGRDIKYSGGA